MALSISSAKAEVVLHDFLEYLESPEDQKSEFMFDGRPLPAYYATPTGNLAFICDLKHIIEKGKRPDINVQAQRRFKFEKDKRGEVGHMVKHLDKVKDENPGIPKFKALYDTFKRNANAVVLIMEEQDAWQLQKKLQERANDDQNNIRVYSEECRDMLDFSRFGDQYRGLQLCDKTFYANEHIPNTEIFGSGCFVGKDVIVTATHVLEEAERSGVQPDKLLFVRRHFVYNRNRSIMLYHWQFFKLAQKHIFEPGRVIYGQEGDTTFVRVAPYSGKPVSNEYWAKMSNKQVKEGQNVYALGHGFGVPMKISFASEVTRVIGSDWFHHDMHVFPGNSGSPVFDSNTQELVGVVSAIHTLKLNIENTQCIDPELNMQDALSVVSSQIGPIKQLISQDHA